MTLLRETLAEERHEPPAIVEAPNAFTVRKDMMDHHKPRALDVQEGGGHYKGMAIQPFEYIHANGIGFAEGCVVKYVSRWRTKGGVEDLRKARHFLDLLIEAEGKGRETR